MAGHFDRLRTGFNFERDLPHQTAAVEAVIHTFDAIGYPWSI